MGWTFFRQPHGMTDIDVCRNEITGCRTGKPADRRCPTIVADAIVKGVHYAAVQAPADRGSHVFAVVTLIEHQRGEIGLKHMDETMGPYYYDAPAAVLAALTPTEYESAKDWRARCGMVAGTLATQASLI